VTQTFNKLAIITALSRQLLAQTGIKASPNGCRVGREDSFLNPFMHSRTAVAHSKPTKAFPKLSPEMATLFAPVTHLPLSHPFC